MTTELSNAFTPETKLHGRDHSLAGAHSGLEALAEGIAVVLSSAGTSFSHDIHGDWALVKAETGDGQVEFALMEPEVPGLSQDALPMRIGLPLAYGLPSGGTIKEKPDTFIYLPAEFDIDQFIALCRGHFSPPQFTELMNFSVRHSMSAPREKFPKSILLMIRDRAELHDAGDKRFELWTQSNGTVRVVELKPTNNPHQAAVEANELGYTPTIYRCSSGRFVSFKSTDGWVFM